MNEESMMISIKADISNFKDGMKGLQDEIKKSTSGAKKNLDTFATNAGKWGKDLTKKVTLPIAGLFAAFGKSAMDLEATEAKYNTVFDGMTAQSDAFIAEFQKLTPATKAEARSMASGIQDLLVPMGFARDEATDMTGEFMHVAGALANFNSGTHTAQDVMGAMQSALTGQYDSLKSLGIQLDATTVKQKAVEMGLADNVNEVDKNMQAQVLMAEVYAQSGDALDAYTEANLDAKTKMGLAKAEAIDVAAELGETLLPAINWVIDGLRDLIDWFKGLSPETKDNMMKFLALAAIIPPFLLLISKIIGGIKIAIGVFKAIKTAMLVVKGVFLALNAPVLIIIGVVAALIAIGVLLYKNWDTVKEKASAIFASIGGTFNAFKEKVSGVFTSIKNKISDTINSAKDTVKSAIDKIKSFFSFKWSLPKLKVPKLNISGKFSLIPPKVPKFNIDWYSNGGIFKRPAILDGGVGVGDASNGKGSKAEVVAPLRDLKQMLGLDGNKGNTTVNLNGNYSFRNKDDMDYLLNQMALVQRRV